MSMLPISLMFAVTVLSSAAIAQGRTWIVDASNGPGTDFTDLPPAVAAASDGDVLVVRAGTYGAFATNKGLRVLGASAANRPIVASTVPNRYAIDVSGLGAGKTFAMKGIRTAPHTDSFALRLSGNAGRVHLESIGPAVASFESVTIANCQEVTIHDYTGAATSQVSVTDSQLVLSRANLRGRDSRSPIFATGGLAAVNSSLWLLDCALRGGDGDPQAGSFFQPAAGLGASSCTIWLAPTTTIAAGTSLHPRPGPTSAIVASSSAIEIDPAVVLIPFLGAPPIAFAAVVTHRLARLDSPGASVGGTLSATLRSGAGDAYLLAFGLPGDPLGTPLGSVFLDVTAFVTVAIGTQAANGTTTFSFGIPNDPSLRGASFAWQGANGFLNQNRIGLTNPRIVTLD